MLAQNIGQAQNSKEYSACQNNRHTLNSGHPQNSKQYSACQNSRQAQNSGHPGDYKSSEIVGEIIHSIANFHWRNTPIRLRQKVAYCDCDSEHPE